MESNTPKEMVSTHSIGKIEAGQREGGRKKKKNMVAKGISVHTRARPGPARIPAKVGNRTNAGNIGDETPPERSTFAERTNQFQKDFALLKFPLNVFLFLNFFSLYLPVHRDSHCRICSLTP
jgi:hypothetical protein